MASESAAELRCRFGVLVAALRIYVNQVARRRARLVLTRVTVCCESRYVTSRRGQLSLLPSATRKMNTGQSLVMLCGWELKGSYG